MEIKAVIIHQDDIHTALQALVNKRLADDYEARFTSPTYTDPQYSVVLWNGFKESESFSVDVFSLGTLDKTLSVANTYYGNLSEQATLIAGSVIDWQNGY